MPSSFVDWIAYGSLILPLSAIAWSAVQYIMELKKKNRYEEYTRLFQVMDNLGNPGGSVASKMAAAYELRKFPDYKDVIVRLCEKVQVDGAGAIMLKEELSLTREYFKKIAQ